MRSIGRKKKTRNLNFKRLAEFWNFRWKTSFWIKLQLRKMISTFENTSIKQFQFSEIERKKSKTNEERWDKNTKLSCRDKWRSKEIITPECGMRWEIEKDKLTWEDFPLLKQQRLISMLSQCQVLMSIKLFWRKITNTFQWINKKHNSHSLLTFKAESH